MMKTSIWFMLALSLLLDGGRADAQTTEVGVGNKQTISAHGVCRSVTNKNNTPLMVPHNSAAEWSVGAASFLADARAGVAVAPCPIPATPDAKPNPGAWRFYARNFSTGANEFTPGGQFGAGIGISDDGMTIVAGEYYKGTSNSGGAVFIYTQNASGIVYQQALRGSGGTSPGGSAEGWGQGARVAVSGNGNTIASSAMLSTGDDVYIFERSGSGWAETYADRPSFSCGGAKCGRPSIAIALNKAGDIAAFGGDGNIQYGRVVQKVDGVWKTTFNFAPRNDYIISSIKFDKNDHMYTAETFWRGSTNSRGRIVEYAFNGTTWTVVNVINAHGGTNAFYAQGMSVSEDGTTMVVNGNAGGAYSYSSTSSVDFYKRQGSGWTLTQSTPMYLRPRAGQVGGSCWKNRTVDQLLQMIDCTAISATGEIAFTSGYIGSAPAHMMVQWRDPEGDGTFSPVNHISTPDRTIDITTIAATPDLTSVVTGTFKDDTGATDAGSAFLLRYTP